jgi:hypothetical protein
MELPRNCLRRRSHKASRKCCPYTVLVRSLYEPHTFLYCPYTAWNRLLIFYKHQCFSDIQFEIRSFMRTSRCMSFILTKISHTHSEVLHPQPRPLKQQTNIEIKYTFKAATFIYIYICVHESAMDVSILWKGTIPFESGSQYKYYTHIYIGESLADEVLRPQPRTLKLQTKHRNQIHVQGCYIYIYIYIYMRARSCNGCLHFVGSNDSVREWKQRQG